MSTPDDDLMAMLTEEERAAMSDDDADADTRAVAEAAKALDDDDDDGAGTPPASDKAEPATTAGSELDQQPEPEPSPSDRYESNLPSDYDEQIKAIKAQDAEFRQKYKDGDIDIDERDEALAGLSEQREQLLVARATAATLEQINEQSGKQQWQRTINTFMSDAAKSEGAIDYRKDAEKAADLDTFVKALGNNPAHADKPMEWFLQEGHRRVQRLALSVGHVDIVDFQHVRLLSGPGRHR